MTANSARNLRVWRQQVGSRCFGHRTELAPRQCCLRTRISGSVSRECLDHFLILHEKQLHRLLKKYVLSFNQACPHQGLGQGIPDPSVHAAPLNQVIAGPYWVSYIMTTKRKHFCIPTLISFPQHMIVHWTPACLFSHFLIGVSFL
jgi:hypothetical protein